MDILVEHGISGKTPVKVFQLHENGDTFLANDTDTLIAIRERFKYALLTIDHWLDRYK